MTYGNVWGSLTFRIAAAIISITCVFYTLLMRTKKTARSDLFVTLLWLTIIDSVSGIISYFAIDSSYIFNVKYFICYACKMVYFMAHFAFIPVFLFYIITVSGVMYRIKIWHRVVIISPIALLEVLLFLNPIIEFMFSYAGNLQFSRRPGIYLAYIFAGFYVAFCIFMLFKYWKNISRVKRIAMAYFMLMVIIGTVIQLIYPQIVCELLADAIGLMGIMIMIEKDDDRIDVLTKAYNRNAFLTDLSNLFMLKREFTTICVRIHNADSYRKILGFDNYENLIRTMGRYIISVNEKYDVYRAAEACFFILCPGINEDELEDIVWQMDERFLGSFDVGEGSTRVKATILAAKTPEQLDSVDDIFLMAEAEIDNKEKTVFIGDDLSFLVRRIEVEKAIGRGISENAFKIVYQPMYSMETGKITAAEARLYLDDSIIGEITNEEFMGVAEDSGFIEEMEIRMIEVVFRFLGTGADRSDMHIEFVLLHLLSIKTLNRDMGDAIANMIERYKIEPSLIAFEISEQNAYLGFETLDIVMNKLKDIGIKLFIGNYSSGYMDLRVSYSESFRGMVLNVRNIIEDTGLENAKILIRTRANMLQQLGNETIFARVDNEEHYQVVKDLKGKCFYGNYFSEPMSKNELQNKFWHGDRVEVQDGIVKHFEEDIVP